MNKDVFYLFSWFSCFCALKISSGGSKYKIFNIRFKNISSTGKVSDSWIRDLGFNPRLHQKMFGVLVWWQRAIIRSGRHRLKLPKKKVSFFSPLNKTLSLFNKIFKHDWRKRHQNLFIYFIENQEIKNFPKSLFFCVEISRI